jgi:hypothetical protein
LEHQIRRTILVSNARTDQPNASNRAKILNHGHFLDSLFQKSDRKHAIAIQAMRQHIAITLLENVQRQQ